MLVAPVNTSHLAGSLIGLQLLGVMIGLKNLRLFYGLWGGMCLLLLVYDILDSFVLLLFILSVVVLILCFDIALGLYGVLRH